MSVALLMTCELTVNSDSSSDDSSSQDNNNGKTGALTYVEKLANGDTSGGKTIAGLGSARSSSKP